MPYPNPSVAPRILSIFTARTPLATVRQYNYVGYFDATMAPTLPIFTNAPVSKLLALRTGVRFPYAIVPMKFKV